MCAFSNIFNFSFKWITCLVVTVGAYTFLHWFLATPLVYSHYHDCCNEKWPRNRFVWLLLGVSFGIWLFVSICIILLWCCLGNCNTNCRTQPNLSLTNGKKESENDNDKKSVKKTKKNGNVEPAEILTLPEFNSKGSFTIIQMNDIQPNGGSIGGGDIPIPADEHLHYVQSEPPEEITETQKTPTKTAVQPNNKTPTDKTDNKNTNKTPDTPKDNQNQVLDKEQPELEDLKSPKSPLKTPREIFFKDLIEAAEKSPSANTYFDFDPSKLTDSILKKYDTPKEEDETEDENTFFVAAHEEKENVTSEVFIALDEKGSVVDKPVKLGQFQVLKE